MEGFLTIHQLSTQFNVSARAIRGRLNKLVTSGKLTEGQDFTRINYVDANHFEWRVNPVTFLQASGLALAPVKLKPLPEATVDAVNAGEPADVPTVNQASSAVHPAVNPGTPPVRQREPVSPTTVHPPVNPGEPAPASPTVEREFLDFLKDQIAVKDGMIKDLTEKIDGIAELNKNLIGKTIQQAERIEELLALPAKSEMHAAKNIKVDEASGAVVHEEQPPRSTEGSPESSSAFDRVDQPSTDSPEPVDHLPPSVNE